MLSFDLSKDREGGWAPLSFLVLSLIGLIPVGEGLNCYSCGHDDQGKEFCDYPSKYIGSDKSLNVTACKAGHVCHFARYPDQHLDLSKARNCIDVEESDCILEVFERACVTKLDQKLNADNMSECKWGDFAGKDDANVKALSDDILEQSYDCYCSTDLCNNMEGMDINGQPTYPGPKGPITLQEALAQAPARSAEVKAQAQAKKCGQDSIRKGGGRSVIIIFFAVLTLASGGTLEHWS